MGLALLHTFSLEGIAEGWTADCKLVYNAVKYAELKELQSVDQTGLTDEVAADNIYKFVSDHFVSGRGITDADPSAISDLVVDDVLDLPISVITQIFTQMNGGKLDPKVIQSEAPQETPLDSFETPITTL